MSDSENLLAQFAAIGITLDSEVEVRPGVFKVMRHMTLADTRSITELNLRKVELAHETVELADRVHTWAEQRGLPEPPLPGEVQQTMLADSDTYLSVQRVRDAMRAWCEELGA
jgi:hypothetical protein